MNDSPLSDKSCLNEHPSNLLFFQMIFQIVSLFCLFSLCLGRKAASTKICDEDLWERLGGKGQEKESEIKSAAYVLQKSSSKFNIPESNSTVIFHEHSFPLCSEGALQAYRRKHGFISRHDFEEIKNFISRVKSIQPADAFTEEDANILKKMRFTSLVEFVSSHFDQSLEQGLYWGDILSLCEKFVLDLKFDQILEILFGFKSLNSLSREEFLKFNAVVAFLRDTQIDRRIENILFLNGFLSEAANTELHFLANKAIFSEDTISFDFNQCSQIARERLCFFVAKIFGHYSREHSNESFSGLKTLRLSNLPRELTFSMEQMLQKNAHSLNSLSISHFFGVPSVAIRFPNLTEIYLNNCTERLNFVFDLHAFYTSLTLLNGFSVAEGSNCFSVAGSTMQIEPLLHFIGSNKNLEYLKIQNQALNSDEYSQKFQSVLGSLKSLKKCEFLYCNPKNLEDYFDSSLESLSIHSDSPSFNWISLPKDFQQLKKFEYGSHLIAKPAEFLAFISNSNLETIAMPKFFPLQGEKEYFEALNGIQSLKSVQLRMHNYEIYQDCALDQRFEALFVRSLRFDPTQSAASTLPSGKGVKFLCLFSAFPSKIHFDAREVEILKQKFPNLQVLFMHNLTQSCGVQLDFETCHIKTVDEIDFFRSLPHLSFGRLN